MSKRPGRRTWRNPPGFQVRLDRIRNEAERVFQEGGWDAWGVQAADDRSAFDHVILVTVSGAGVDIANLRLGGILDKTGHLPGNGDSLCFEAAVCGDPE